MYGYGLRYGKIGGAVVDGLLDFYGGAGFAYSFRKLRAAYAGSSIRARESSGNTEQNIGFSSEILNASSLLTFTGSNDGLLPIIYDQSENANNQTQTTAGNQLEIVDAGSLVTSNSLAATQGDSNRGGETSSIAFSGMSEFWFFDVIDVAATASTQMLYESSVAFTSYTGAFAIYISGGKIKVANRLAGSNLINNYNVSTGRQLISVRLISGADSTLFSEVYINGAEIAIDTSTGAGTSSFTDQLIHVNARAGSSLGFTGKRQESIFYPSDQSANRVGIETNLNDYYGIY